MRFSVYQPPQAKHHAVPVLFYLAGLTCNEETFMIKAGAQRFAAQHGIMLVAPDTSPRNTGIAGADRQTGISARAPDFIWTRHRHRGIRHFQHGELCHAGIAPPDRATASRHAPTASAYSATPWADTARWCWRCAIRTFSARCRRLHRWLAPTQCPWGQKAFTHYLGADQTSWQQYDASDLDAEPHHALPARHPDRPGAERQIPAGTIAAA